MKVAEPFHLHGQMSDSFRAAVFIILSGGFQDAYTYFCRGEVFANAQTGNIVLFSAYLFEGNFSRCLHYLVPLLAFMVGIFAAECIHRHYKYMEKVHWRQLIVLAEIVLLFIVGFLPQEVNTFANALVSFVCAMQVQTFRKVNGYSYASTMCIGNLRSGTAAFSMYLRDKRPEQLRQSLYYFGIILFFAIGAGIGGNLSMRYGIHMIWVSVGCLLVSFFMMFSERVK